jgi:quercetin dioxygenase-like cupin family protein
MRHVEATTTPGQLRPNGRIAYELLDETTNGTRIAVMTAYHHPGFVEDQHFHRQMTELLYFLAPAVYLVSDQEVHVAGGDLLVIEPGEPHGALAVPHAVTIHVTQIPKVDGDKHPHPSVAGR